MATDTELGTDLRQYVAIVRARKLTVVAITALVTVAAIVVSSRRTSIFEAHAEVLVRPTSDAVGGGVSLPQPPNMDTERLVAVSEAVARTGR